VNDYILHTSSQYTGAKPKVFLRKKWGWTLKKKLRTSTKFGGKYAQPAAWRYSY
jgi:hypothetical protein